ncbi:hypothetical protein LDENG_00029160 [Lucifuga dentata]|nr:hypothetical protein LDENG_00029160 [Lucifuga dentata]
MLSKEILVCLHHDSLFLHVSWTASNKQIWTALSIQLTTLHQASERRSFNCQPIFSIRMRKEKGKEATLALKIQVGYGGE